MKVKFFFMSESEKRKRANLQSLEDDKIITLFITVLS